MNATRIKITTVGDRIVKTSEGPLPSSMRWIDLVEQNQIRPTYAAFKNKQRRVSTRPASARLVEATPRWPKRSGSCEVPVILCDGRSDKAEAYSAIHLNPRDQDTGYDNRRRSLGAASWKAFQRGR
jgi:hypothetical protein